MRRSFPRGLRKQNPLPGGGLRVGGSAWVGRVDRETQPPVPCTCFVGVARRLHVLDVLASRVPLGRSFLSDDQELG
jgi:hypothetical protein